MCSATSLHNVLCEGKWKLVDIEKLLQRDSSSVHERDFESRTPLISVLQSENCSADVVKLLLKYGADVNCEDTFYETPLYIALAHSREDAIILALIENGADVHVSGLDSRSSLCEALHCGASTDVIQMLLDKGCSLNACELHDGSVLHCATDNPRSVLNSTVFQMLLGRGANIKAVNSEGRSVVCFALQGGNNAHSIKLLLEAGGSLNGCPIHASPLLCATDVECSGLPLKASLVQLLLKAGACADTVNAEGLTPLQCALQNCPYEKEAITLLLDCHKGVDLNSLVDKDNNSLLNLAVSNFNCIPSVVKLLIKRGVKVDKVKEGGTTELYEAVWQCNPKCKPSIIKTLLKNGAKVNYRIVLLSVHQCLDAEIVKILLASGASIISKSSFGSLLHVVLRQCSGNPATHVCLKLLAKYDFLKGCVHDMRSLGSSRNLDLRSFEDQCRCELFKIQSSVCFPLYKFLIGSSSPYDDAVDRQTEEKMDEFDRLLKIIALDAFPLYFDVISERIGRNLMEIKLQEIFVYSVSYLPDNAQEEIVLHYYNVLEIARYLTNEDLLRFILAFYNADGRVSNAQDIKGKKRTAEESDLCCKYPKL